MAKRLTQDQWVEIKTKYQMGDSNNSIALKYDIPESTIRAKAKRENWTRELRTQISDVKSKIKDIANSCEPSQFPIIEQEITEAMQIMKSITNLQKGALNLHGTIIKKAMHQTSTGEITPREASQILANVGLKVDQIHKMNSPEQPQTAIQINNDISLERQTKITYEQIKGFIDE